MDLNFLHYPSPMHSVKYDMFLPILALFCRTPKWVQGSRQIKVNAWTGSFWSQDWLTQTHFFWKPDNVVITFLLSSSTWWPTARCSLTPASSCSSTRLTSSPIYRRGKAGSNLACSPPQNTHQYRLPGLHGQGHLRRFPQFCQGQVHWTEETGAGRISLIHCNGLKGLHYLHNLICAAGAIALLTNSRFSELRMHSNLDVVGL